jgi:enolase-phosphatase E1
MRSARGFNLPDAQRAAAEPIVPPRLVLLDIEGTIAPIRFVHDVLFPFARTRLSGFLARHADDPEVAASLADLGRIAPGAPPLETLHALMDRDAKVAPLKFIQGRIWAEGFAEGALQSQFYPEVLPVLAAWQRAGTRLAIYSSGSRQAQRLLFAHSAEGDRTGLIAAFFDTAVGGKRETASYVRIAEQLAQPVGEILFLSDVGAELDAATGAGMMACQLVRAEDGTVPAAGHPHDEDLTGVARRYGLSEPQ